MQGAGARAGRDGREYADGVVTVDYPHIRPRSYPVPAEAMIRVAPLALPSIARIGYVRGASDRVPEALAGVGLPVKLLDGATLERGDLAGSTRSSSGRAPTRPTPRWSRRTAACWSTRGAAGS